MARPTRPSPPAHSPRARERPPATRRPAAGGRARSTRRAGSRQAPSCRRVYRGPARRRGDGAPAARREPLPHAAGGAGVLGLADFGPGRAGLGALGLALSLRFLLRLLDVGPASPLEAVVPPATHRTLTGDLIGEILARVARPGFGEGRRAGRPFAGG